MSEVLYKIVILVIIFHLLQKVSIRDVELFQHCLKCNKCQLCLKKIGTIQAIQTVSSKNAMRFFEYLVGFSIKYIVS